MHQTRNEGHRLGAIGPDLKTRHYLRQEEFIGGNDCHLDPTGNNPSSNEN